MKTRSEIALKLRDLYVSLRCALPVPRYPLKSKERYAPFFIIGSGRSGNTLLRKLLNRSSAIHIPPETYVLGHAISRFRQYRSMSWSDLVDFILSDFEFYPEFETFSVSLRPLAQELKCIPETSRNLACVLDHLYRYCIRQMGSECRRWGDKTPLNTFYLGRIQSVFPDAQFIHMLRDGCDVVSSYLESGIYQTCEEAAERWKTSVELAEQFLARHPGSGITIRYEDLVNDPRVTMETLCRFLSIESEPKMLDESTDTGRMGDVEIRHHHQNVVNPVNTQSIGKGRMTLSREEKIAIQRIIGDQLTRLGYESCTS